MNARPDFNMVLIVSVWKPKNPIHVKYTATHFYLEGKLINKSWSDRTTMSLALTVFKKMINLVAMVTVATRIHSWTCYC